MAIDNREQLGAIRTFPSLVKYLREELDWPITTDDFDELTFDYAPEELGIDAANAAKIQEIKRMRPLSASQPWGIFFVKFEPKRLPVVALRRILSRVVLKKRASAHHAERAAWAPDDLLFISSYGEEEERRISFAHFSVDSGTADLPILKVLGWDNLDTPLHLDHVADTLSENLRWPDDDENVEKWRRSWRSAFTLRHREVITTSRELSIRLAELARAIRDRIKSALAIETKDGPLTKLMKAFQEALVHDLDVDGFADMYAQTIAYGLLSARITDPGSKTTEDLSAHMRTNPLLRELMTTFLSLGGSAGESAGLCIDFDELGVGEVAALLDRARMEEVIRDFGDRNPQEDPVIHFYELFLTEYDARKRMQRGVFYTPRPVVSYIVRSVDELLRTEFGLEDGLADTTTWGEMTGHNRNLSIPDGVSPDQPFVQILDPATGTGTFLVEVIDRIYRTMSKKWETEAGGPLFADVQERWNEYVPKHLLPRIHGYELLMAPYAIAHLKVGLKLYETGYRFASDERARIYLTNALEPAQDFSGHLEFAIPALAHEARAVNRIKTEQRFTVVIGNPPYANFGQLNRMPFILGLLEDYKVGLNEKKLNLDDDYLKFLRLSQYLIAETKLGILGLITNSSYLDGVTHRRIRESLLNQFSVAVILDLHGNSRRGDVAPDGTEDNNVFDIQQGVAIGLWTSRDGTKPAQIGYGELWGTRESKYEFLARATSGSSLMTELTPVPTQFLLVPRDQSSMEEYRRGLPLKEIFSVIGSGLNTDRDELCIDFEEAPLRERMERVFSGTIDEDFVDTYNFRPSSSYDPACLAKRQSFDPSAIQTCIYRPFDFRRIYYKVGFTSRPVFHVQGHMLRPNLGLLVCRQSKEPFAVLVTRYIATHKIVAVYDRTSLAPLWLYGSESEHEGLLAAQTHAQVNLQPSFMSQIAGAIGMEYSHVLTEEVFGYLYAVFYSPRFRDRYAELLKDDYPRLPLPGGPEVFRQLAQLGGELVAIHVLESPAVGRFITTYLGPKEPEVARVRWSNSVVCMDAGTRKNQSPTASTIGFHGVPEEVWNFHIGGYQVCEKWLKDRKGRRLSDEDIAHYQKIVVALNETIRIMGEIDEVIEKHGGWPGAFRAGE